MMFVYMIRPTCEHDIGDVYIGSTTQPLWKRFSGHGTEYKNKKYCSSHQLFDKYGKDNCQILLIEDCSGNSVKHLRQREIYHIQINICVNEIDKLFDKQKYLKNYGLIHADELKIYKQQYFQNNKELYYKNREEKKHLRYECECGSSVRLLDKTTHCKTKKHINWGITNKNTT